MRCWLVVGLVNYGNAKFARKRSKVVHAKWPNITLKPTRSNPFSPAMHATTLVERRRCTKPIEWVIWSSIHVNTAERYLANILALYITWIRTRTNVNTSVTFARKNSTLLNMLRRTSVKCTEIRRRYLARATHNTARPVKQSNSFSCWSTPASCAECASSIKTICSIIKRDTPQTRIRNE